jgi:hypothetical protein
MKHDVKCSILSAIGGVPSYNTAETPAVLSKSDMRSVVCTDNIDQRTLAVGIES